MLYRKQKTTKSASKLVKAGVFLFIALLAVGGYMFINYLNKPQLTGDVDYSPPTKEQQEAGERIKEEIIADKNSEDGQNDATSDIKSASVIITDAAQYGDTIEVRSFISNHYQDGTCTITFQNDGQTVTKETPAYRDATTTICTNPLIKKSDFPSGGEWQVTVSYTAKGANGTSKAQSILIE